MQELIIIRSLIPSTIAHINKVSSIRNYIQQFTIKQCCFFNGYPVPISAIKAEQAFNLLDNIDSEPSKLPMPGIEKSGFALWVFSGAQTCLLKDKNSKK